MSRPTQPWTADDIAKLNDLGQKHPAKIAAKLLPSPSAPATKARDLKSSLKVARKDERALSSGADPSAAGFDWPIDFLTKIVTV
jgi:hypothetical protein